MRSSGLELYHSETEKQKPQSEAGMGRDSRAVVPMSTHLPDAAAGSLDLPCMTGTGTAGRGACPAPGPEKAEAPRGISPRGFLDRLRGADQRVTSKYFDNFS
ncbi:MAG: hypothetical protein AAB433_07615, partial [Nitrospirota bacterium]